MRRSSLVLMVTLWPPVMALSQEDDLRGGMLIVHAPPGMTFSAPPPAEGWCARYSEGHAISDAAEQVVRIEAEVSRAPAIWFVLAAWHESKRVCAAEFGLGDYDQSVFAIEGHGPCGVDPQTIPTIAPPWPEPNSGIAIAWPEADAPSGNYIPIYFFGGYVYGSDVSTSIPLVEDPGVVNPFMGFASCATPPVLSPAVGGVLGINTDGVAVMPIAPPPLGACCDAFDTCELLTEEDCTATGGDWLADSLQCHNPGTCAPVGACCYGHNGLSCEVQTEPWCLEKGCWVWLPETPSCDPNPCEPIQWGACCAGEDCSAELEETCAAAGGEWMWGQTCTPNPCVPWAVCCNGGGCDLWPVDRCTDSGGTWHESETSCDGGICQEGACCIEGICVVLPRIACEQGAGVPTFHEGLICELLGRPRDCETVAVCCIDWQCYLMFEDECEAQPGWMYHSWRPSYDSCFPDPCWECCWGACCVGLECRMLPHERDCSTVGGEFLGHHMVCMPNPCDPDPAHRVSWGTIKHLYR